MNFEKLRIFWFAAVVTAVVTSAVGIFLGPESALIAGLLIVLEITFSFENAVINAKTLSRLSDFWQQVFMTLGIAIAVFGMRIVFPLVLVALTGHLTVAAVLDLALHDPQQYSVQLESSMPVIAAFGSAFLMMVFLHYFIFENQGRQWYKSFERAVGRLPKTWATAPLISLTVALIVNGLLAPKLLVTLLAAAVLGIVTHMAINGFIHLLEKRQLAKSAGLLTGWAGLAGFMYLEVLDASFSFDGVIGAFAITDSVILIAAGLGAGAVWVRSMTVFLVRHETLAKYAFLEQGAHYAIGLLALVLLVSIRVHVPEIVTGLAGVGIILMSLFSSKRLRARPKIV